ncbi:MAG: hypothetical protein HQK68_13235 [Desulfamplus sp.]|nr:hypothetical protein [Desulfamplus sp.]
MTPKTTLEKRVKRRVTAREHRFFAVCAPGIKGLCQKEIVRLNQKFGDIEDKSIEFKDIDTIKGGVEFTTSVKGCYAANLYLRSPSKILMRIAKFKAENFRTFEKKFSEIEWELYFKPSAIFESQPDSDLLCTLHFEASTSRSRLYHTDAITDRARLIVYEHFNKIFKDNYSVIQPDSPKKSQTVLIRAEDDQFEISIDSSGELLHKRGLKENVGVAPLRETIAFAILSALKYPNFSDKKGAKTLPLIDAMCGSGTFTLEAAMMANSIPAGFFRQFAFQEWQCFSLGQLNHLKKVALNQILTPCYDNRSSIFAVDQDANILEGLKKVVDRLKADNLTPSSQIEIIHSNFFDVVPEKLTDQKGFLVLNPPYGRRIGEKQYVEEIFNNIGKKLKSDFKGWRVGVITPDKRLLKHLPAAKSLIPIFHGGLQLDVAIIYV